MEMARAASTLMMPMKAVKAPMMELAAEMQKKSMAQARNRLIGPASNCEKRIPSGVRMSSVLVLAICLL
jgi:hypothetical protein